MTKINALQLFGIIAILSTPFASLAQEDRVTFHKDIEPILQRSCQGCHRVGGVGPMPLVNYEQVAPYAGLIEYKTSIRDRAGAMPPWYVEKGLGIQNFKNDVSLSERKRTIALSISIALPFFLY